MGEVGFMKKKKSTRLRKVLSKHTGVTEFLMNPNGSFTENDNEMLELLLTTHFLACKDKVNEES